MEIVAGNCTKGATLFRLHFKSVCYLGSIFNSKVIFIRFGLRGSHVKLEIGDNNEEIAFFPRSLQLIECPN